MFSSRLPPSLEENRISRALEAARASGRLRVDATESNPTVVGLSQPTELLRALADPRALTYRPEPRGLAGAREAIAGYYRRHGVTVEPAQLFLTASTSEAYSWLFKLLCDPGDDVLVPQPSYPLFDVLAGLESTALRPYPLRHHHGWYLDVEEVRRAIGPRTRAILVVNPHNPTGSFLKRDEHAQLVALAAERGLALISDEVFAETALQPDERRVTTLAGESPALTFCLSGLSKLVGLPQLKLGWIVVGGPASVRAEAEARLEHIADAFLSVNQPVQEAAPALLALVDDVGAQLRERVRRNRAALVAALDATAATVLAGEGGWSAIVRVPATKSEEEWVLSLLDEGLLAHPGYFFELPPTHLVLSLILPEPAFSTAIHLLRARVDAET